MWKGVLLDLGVATFPKEFAERVTDRLFPRRQQKAVRVKTPLTWEVVERIIAGLMKNLDTDSAITEVLALRDILIIWMGFGHLMRRSELVDVALNHIVPAFDAVFIPKSKTDQAGKGIKIPLIRVLPGCPDIIRVWEKARDVWKANGWTRLFVKYVKGGIEDT